MFENNIDKKKKCSYDIRTISNGQERKNAMLEVIERIRDVGIEVVVLDGNGEVAYFPQLQVLYLHQNTPRRKIETIAKYILENRPKFTPEFTPDS